MAHRASEILRNIALVAIPFVLWYASRSAEKQRATLNLIRALESAPEIVERLERLYRYRKFEEGVEPGLSQTPPNPYADFQAQFLFDSVIVLNYYEAACAEIEAGAIHEELIYKSVRNSVIGMRDVVLTRYSEKVGSEQSKNYVRLCAVADRWKARASSFGELGATRIPGD